LGKGGMGIVYLAEQIKPLRRRVALKLIKQGMDTEQTLARFGAEREALALMSHRGVAKVFDAGVSEDGRPYFVMEYVPGLPITDYCDLHRLNTEERLQLFIEVCQAVQHAHQKGIIHRDIKPSNVLVSDQDGMPEPKIIDFGLAKATQQRLVEQTLFTEHGQFIGTPGYMSPEQADLTALDIDTRTDIYSLGVLLYEMLVGARPFDDVTLRKAALAEIQRIIREVDPPKPSTRLSGLGPTSTNVADKRRTEVSRLCRMLRGDLDWIVMKCLEKDRNRRYQSANALADELGRYLRNEPVEAGAPTVGYRLRKFVVRNKTLVGAGSAVFLALAIGLAVALAGLGRARAERDAAQAERDRTATVLEYLELVFGFGEQTRKDIKGETPMLSAETRLGDFLRFAESGLVAFDDQPSIDRSVRGFLSRAYHRLGLIARSQTIFESAARSYRERGKLADAVRLETDAAETLIEGGGYVSARSMLERSLQDLESLSTVTNDDFVRTLSLLAQCYDPGAEIQQLEAIVGTAERYLDETVSNENRALQLAASGLVKFGNKDFIGAIEDFRKGRDLLPLTDPSVPQFTFNVAYLQAQQGDLDAADRTFKDMLSQIQRGHGADQPIYAQTLKYYADFLTQNNQAYKAIEPVRESLDAQQRLGRGVSHPVYFATMLNLLESHRLARVDLEEALALARQFRRDILAEFGEHSEQALRGIFEVTSTLDAMKAYTDETEALYREEWALMERVKGQDHWMTLASQQRLAHLLMKRGKLADAAELCEDGLRRATASSYGPEWHGPFEHVYVRVLLAQDKLAEAERRLSTFVDTEPKQLKHVLPGVCAIVQEYEGLGEPTKATAWRDRLASQRLSCQP
jgi:hypothetical protein